MPQRSWDNCHHRQRRQLPSETFRFAPSRRSSLRSFRVLATLSLAPALHAVPSRHPFTWPWAAMGFARAQPATCLVNHSTNSSIGTSESIPVDGTGGWQSPYLPGVGQPFPDVTRPEQNQRVMAIFILTLHVRKTGSSETGKGSGKTRSGVSQRVRNSVFWGHGIELFQNVW